MSTTTDERPTEAEEIPEAEVVPEGEVMSQELVHHHQGYMPQARVIAGDDPEQILANATTIANSLKKLVEAQGFAVNMGGRKPHLEVGAWQAMGALLGALGGEPLHPETEWSRPVGEKTTYHVHEKKKKYGNVNGKRGIVEETELDYDVEGIDWEARVAVKTAAGVVVGVSEGMCSRAESQWMQKPDPALKSMAETRAASRAFRASLGWVVAIAGYNPTPAEEIPTGAQEQGPPYGPPVTEAQLANARAAIGYLFDPDDPVAPDHNVVGLVLNGLEQAAGYLPHFALSTVVRVASAVKQRRSAPADAEPEPAEESDEDRQEREYAEAQMAEQAPSDD